MSHNETSRYPHPIIAREGWSIIGFFFITSLALQYFYPGGLSGFSWFLTVFALQFFRDPYRHISGDVQSIVSAADGRIINISQEYDPYLQRNSIKISIFMNIFNVHSNRSPVDGQVVKKWYSPGKFFNASLDKASENNERCALWMRMNDGTDITCVQIAGLVARRILSYPEEGEILTRGSRYGFIRFGSRIDLYLPLHAELKVSLGQTVRASSTLIAQL